MAVLLAAGGAFGVHASGCVRHRSVRYESARGLDALQDAGAPCDGPGYARRLGLRQPAARRGARPPRGAPRAERSCCRFGDLREAAAAVNAAHGQHFSGTGLAPKHAPQLGLCPHTRREAEGGARVTATPTGVWLRCVFQRLEGFRLTSAVGGRAFLGRRASSRA